MSNLPERSASIQSQRSSQGGRASRHGSQVEKRGSISRSTSHISHRFEDIAEATKSGIECLGCRMTGNAVSLLTAAFLFALITAVQYIYAVKANSLALQADCISMAVDSLSFLGNLFAECAPNNENKRRIQLTMSGISHFLLLGFTIYFIIDAVGTLTGDEDDDVTWYIVFAFALGGLLFDAITLIIYVCFGEKTKVSEEAEEPNPLEPDTLEAGGELVDANPEPEDALTCGINTNMCAALLHVLSDLGRSTTTLVESLILHWIPSIPGNKADGVAALIICGVIVIGSVSACLVWAREVYVYITTPAFEGKKGGSAYQRMN